MPPPDPSSTEEIQRQWALLWAERWERIPLSGVAIMLTAIYLPLWVALFFAAANIFLEIISMQYMRGLDPQRHPRRHSFVTLCSFMMELTFVLPPVLVFQLDENYSKAFAVGMISMNLIQLIGVRSIYQTFGRYGLLGNAAPVLIGNTAYWLRTEDYLGLLVSSIAAAGALGYTLVIMQSNNLLHRTAARDRAAALDSARAKSRFLAQMSHELRTPLNAILGMGHAELRRSRDTLSQNRLSVLIASAEGLSTILDDILDISAVEAGHLPIRPQTVIPADEIAATLLLFQPNIIEAGLTLHHDIGPGLDSAALADPQRLRQCLSNLLSNALKNTVHGGIHVTSTLHENGPLLQIEVADTGPGIPSDRHASLFEPSPQGHNARPGTQSNGLGLSISRAMARQMGGDLVLRPNSPTTSGAQFVLTLALGAADLPASDAAPRDAATRDGSPRVAAGPGHDTAPRTAVAIAGLRVLVIDDIATNRLVASTYLRMLGASMIEAESGAQALTILASQRADLVLLDMNMPDMNGLQTLAKIRALPGDAGKIPVIAMTADAMAQHRSLYLSSGMDGYIAKPINPARIEAEFRAVLDKAGQGLPD